MWRAASNDSAGNGTHAMIGEGSTQLGSSEITPMPCFQINDPVVIDGPVTTPYTGRKGIILDFKPVGNTGDDTSLDKYLVKFADGDQEWFFELQLSAPDQQRKRRQGRMSP